MTLPTFIVIGAMKAGTTSLWGYLGDHPDVFMSAEKEPEFFVEEKTWGRGRAWYESLFADGATSTARGEASTSYTKHPFFAGVPERMVSVVPDARLVYVLRHPLDRMASHHRHAVSEWGWQGSLDELILDPARRVELIGTSKYAKQIDRYLARFDREQLCVITSEDLHERRVPTLRAVYAHLGVDPDFVPGEVATEANRGADHRRQGSAVRNLRDRPAYRAVRRAVPSGVRNLAWRAVTRPPVEAGPSRLSPGMRASVLAELRPDLERLRAHLGADFHCWGLLDGQPAQPEG